MERINKRERKRREMHDIQIKFFPPHQPANLNETISIHITLRLRKKTETENSYLLSYINNFY